MGPSWGHLGASWRSPGGPRPPKTVIFLRFFKVFGIEPSSLQLRLSCPMLRHLGPSWGHLRALLDSHRAILGPSWGPLGPSWGSLGPSWGLHGATLGPFWLILGPSWATSGLLGALVGHLGTFLSHGLLILGELGPFGASLGAFWSPSRPILMPLWGHLWEHSFLFWFQKCSYSRSLWTPPNLKLNNMIIS